MSRPPPSPITVAEGQYCDISGGGRAFGVKKGDRVLAYTQADNNLLGHDSVDRNVSTLLGLCSSVASRQMVNGL